MGGWWCFFFQAEGGIRDLSRSRGLGDVYKRQQMEFEDPVLFRMEPVQAGKTRKETPAKPVPPARAHLLPVCLLYTSDPADQRSSVDLGGGRII